MSLKEEMLSMKNWVVYGFSNDPEKFGYKIAKILLKKGYKVAGINKKYKGQEIDNIKVYESIDDVPFKVEVADMVVNPGITNSVIDEIKRNNIKNVWLQPGSFDDQTVKRLNLQQINFIDDDCVYRILKEE